MLHFRLGIWNLESDAELFLSDSSKEYESITRELANGTFDSDCKLTVTPVYFFCLILNLQQDSNSAPPLKSGAVNTGPGESVYTRAFSSDVRR